MIADIPGLIEGAHDGAGLGDRFLGHIERCRVLIHLVDGTQADVAGAYRTVRRELAAYEPELARRPELVCLNKVDALGEEEIAAKAAALRAAAQSAGVPDLGRRPPRSRGGAARGACRDPAGARGGAGMSARRLVIKIGSSLLVDGAGRLRREWLDSFAADLAACRQNGQEAIVVTSGAIALGRAALGLKARVLRLEDKQAAAAVGQINLAHAYQASLAQHGLPTAQLLLTLGDTESRRQYLNARSTIEALLKLGVVPVVNENDTVATNEIRFGDNDRLSARVAVMASADELILLSDVDGLYTADPSRHEGAVRLARGQRDHAGDRGHGGRRGQPRRHRRHGQQARGRPDRDPRRLRRDHRAGLRSEAARAPRRGRSLHALRRPRQSPPRPQGVDRRRRLPPWEYCGSMAAPPGRCAAAAACCRPGWSRSRARSSAAMR